MKRIFKVTTLPNAPKLVISASASYFESFQSFRGDYKVNLSPREAFEGELVDGEYDWRQFYYLAPGVLVLPEKAWEYCDAMYYVCSMGSELLLIKSSVGNFRAINPVDVAPPPTRAGELCNLETFFAPLFRLPSLDPESLFCVSGSGVDDDEFKFNYDSFGFKGLAFEEIWSEPNV